MYPKIARVDMVLWLEYSRITVNSLTESPENGEKKAIFKIIQKIPVNNVKTVRLNAICVNFGDQFTW